MDAPNAPNPANPNAQYQFMDAVQGPANQVQGPAVQNQAQGPANNNGQMSQNVPMQPPQQPAPQQPGPMVQWFLLNQPQYNQAPLVQWCLPLKCFIKIG